MTEDELAILRRGYAHQMVAMTGVPDAPLERAFATVKREAFLGPGPWLVHGFNVPPCRVRNPDPALIYQDVLVTLDEAHGVNNGSPSLHAMMLHALAVRPGETVLHVGAGSGYYTALLAELVGAHGRVTAVEIDPALAARAAENLRPWPNVTVIAGDGAAYPTEAVRRIYVNCAVAQPAASWLDRLEEGGTLVMPLGAPRPDATGTAAFVSANGALLLITHAEAGYAVRHLSPCRFVCAQGPLAGTAEQRLALFGAFGRGGQDFIGSLRRGDSPPQRCWFWSPDWSLSYDPP
jgi:protein-L-isoaspartate(D-aspartate) O-methyltransferase